MEVVYDFFRGSVGLALVVSGISLWLNPDRPGVFRSFGTLFFCVGTLFALSTLDPLYPLPFEVGNLAVVALVYFVGLSTFEVSLFFFGGPRHQGLGRTVATVGAVWSLVLWVVPLADGFLPWSRAWTMMEATHPVGFLHLVAGGLVYLWPIAVLVVASLGTRSSLKDIPSNSRSARVFLTTLLAVLTILVTVVLATVVGSVDLYRLAHSLLEAVLLGWYFYVVRFPKAFGQVQREIEVRHREKVAFEDSEASIIAGRLATLVEQKIFCDPRLDLEFLAKRIQVPAYRLSQFFNRRLQTTFSAWLNALRIDFVKTQFAARPGAKVIDLAYQAGYASKSIFYAQFRKLEGLSPAEYRSRG